MFGFLKKKQKQELSPRETLIADIEHEYDVWLTHVGEMSREIKHIPDLMAQQSTVEKLQTSGLSFLKEGDNAETLKKMDLHYTRRINECACSAIAEFKRISDAWDRICEIRRKIDADTNGVKEVP